MHTLTVSYRPDNYPEWVFWKTFTQGLDLLGRPSELDIGGVPTARPGFAPRLSFGKPPDDYDLKETSRKMRRGYQFQIKFNGTGHVIIDRCRLHAQKLIERSRAKS